MLEVEVQNNVAPKEELNLEFILENNWDLVLDRLSGDMNPWNINIEELANRYKTYINSMEDYNLKIPARFILVCSILLRMKADILFGKKVLRTEEPIEEFEDDFCEEVGNEETYIPNLTLPVRRSPVRRVTLEDLKLELAKAMNIEDMRKQRWSERKKDFGIHLKKSDIEEKLTNMMDTLRTVITGNKSVDFEELLKNKDKKEVVEKFVNILQLETGEKIKCTQKEFLGKILIKLKKEVEDKNDG